MSIWQIKIKSVIDPIEINLKIQENQNWGVKNINILKFWSRMKTRLKKGIFSYFH